MRKQYDFSKGKRGAILRRSPTAGKTRITIGLDKEVLEWFGRQAGAAGGGGTYQSLINAALRQHIAREREPLEATLRRVVREELRRHK